MYFEYKYYSIFCRYEKLDIININPPTSIIRFVLQQIMEYPLRVHLIGNLYSNVKNQYPTVRRVVTI